ncbi:hypothetical protein [Actinotalea sp. JY-7885]|uniref:hypothetical protein n=1 Tax=Actinotalea sp. JY-7885 TaxID=2758576 RepID=UPI00165E734B|nr:hypothetical protein [Actinotalea sp. JY-7885]
MGAVKSGSDHREMVLELIDGMTAPDRRRRERAADEITDVLDGHSEEEAFVVSCVLATLARREDDEACLEAELHTLTIMAERGVLHRSVLEHVLAIDRSALRGSCIDYYDYFLGLRGSDWGQV